MAQLWPHCSVTGTLWCQLQAGSGRTLEGKAIPAAAMVQMLAAGAEIEQRGRLINMRPFYACWLLQPSCTM